MGKSVAGEIVVLPFPQTNLQAGKRRPASVILYTAARLKTAKLDETLASLRQLFS